MFTAVSMQRDGAVPHSVIIDVATGLSTRMTAPDTNRGPEWDAEGRFLYYTDRAGAVYRTAADGSTTPSLVYRPTTDVVAWNAVPAGDGSLVMRVSAATGGQRVVRFRP